MTEWQEQTNEILANIHPTEIVEGIIKPSIEQVILDLEDSLQFYDEDDAEGRKITEEQIAFWTAIQLRIELAEI